MASYVNTYTGREVSSEVTLGYPYVLIDDSTGEPEGVEFAERTADAILVDVGSDATLAAIALEQEQAREKPRKVLSNTLRRIIADAEDE